MAKSYSDSGIVPGTTKPRDVNTTQQKNKMSNIELAAKKTIAKKQGNTYSDRGLSPAPGGPIVHDAVTTTPTGQVLSQYTGPVSQYNKEAEEAEYANRKAEQDAMDAAANAVRNAVASYNPNSGGRSGGNAGGGIIGSGTSSTSSPAAPAPTTTKPTTTTGSAPKGPTVEKRSGVKFNRSAQVGRTNRKSPRSSNSLTDQELRKLAARRFR